MDYKQHLQACVYKKIKSYLKKNKLFFNTYQELMTKLNLDLPCTAKRLAQTLREIEPALNESCILIYKEQRSSKGYRVFIKYADIAA